MRRSSLLTVGPALALIAIALPSCDREEPAGPPPASGSAAAPSASAAAAVPEAPPSPFHVVLESKAPIAFSGLAGGVWIADAQRTRIAQAAGAADLVEAPMPAGLPEGRGRVLRAFGKLPRSIWLSFETQREDGKAEATPLYRLTRDAFSRIAEDWQPQIAPWSKGRLLSASTSSGKLKMKVIEPQVNKAPPDLPGARIDDISCEKTLKLKGLAALPSGEVFAAASCTPDGAAGARYVVVRWVPPDAAAPPPATSASAGPPADAGAPLDAGTALDTGAPADAGDDGGLPGTVSIMPEAAQNLTHRALHARAANEVYAAATAQKKGEAASHLFRFDGAAWSREPLPPIAEPLRGLSGASDGTLWMVTEHEIWKRAPSGAWERVPPPTGAFPEPDPVWEISDVWAQGADDVWIAARHASKTAERHVVLRLRPQASAVQWP